MEYTLSKHKTVCTSLSCPLLPLLHFERETDYERTKDEKKVDRFWVKQTICLLYYTYYMSFCCMYKPVLSIACASHLYGI